MKTIGLDVGDVWVGTALSDALGIIARPLETVPFPKLDPFLAALFQEQRITTAIIGNPITMKGEESAQTKKVHGIKADLEKKFPKIEWRLWDERLSSKRADTVKRGTSKSDKRASHSKAAAFILQTYLDYTAFSKDN